MYQLKLSPEQIKEGNRLLCEFHKEFEDLYVQRCAEQIHFLCHSIHLLTHIGPETICAGPLGCYAQWTMETAIGNLGDEICQDKDPYANIAQRGLLRAWINSILSIMPDVLSSKDELTKVPWGGKDLGNGYALLQACQLMAINVSD